MNKMTPARKLQIQFTKALRKGYVKNAQLYPQAPELVIRHLEESEPVIVRIDARTVHYYWFTDRRLLWQIGNTVCPLFRYEDVDHVHWITKNPFQKLDPRLSAEQGIELLKNMKRENYDRLVVEVDQREIPIYGLDQAYSPTLSFLEWIIPVQPRDAS